MIPGWQTLWKGSVSPFAYTSRSAGTLSFPKCQRGSGDDVPRQPTVGTLLHNEHGETRVFPIATWLNKTCRRMNALTCDGRKKKTRNVFRNKR